TIISRIKLNADSEIKYVLSENSFGTYLFLVEGEIQLNNTTLTTKDGIGIEDCKEFKIKAKKDSFLINIEI
nr:hypothetical protein [Prolixibacteraceae bacterium]